MKEIKTGVNNSQYIQIQNYCKKQKISIWKLVKDSVLDRINNKTMDNL